MTNVAAAPSKKKRFSKKSKESWRKRIDITDVDTFLEEQRQEERIGKFSDKSDAELFTIDRKSDPKLLTERQRRKLVGQRPPRCFASLENTSKVTDPIVKRNKVRTQTHYLVERAAKRASGNLNKRDVQSAADQLKEFARQDERQQTRGKVDPFTKDVWTIGSLKDQRTEFKGEWIEQHVTEHNLVNTGTPVAGVPKSAFHKRSQLNALPVPHPGTSYNPSLKDHQDLMAMVTETEEKIIRKEDHLNRVTTSMFDKVTAGQRDANRLHEFNAILHEPDDEPSTDDDDETNTTGYKAVNAPVVVKRKDAKARRKQREQRELRQALAARKEEKKKITDLHRLRHLQQDVLAADADMRVARVGKQIRKLERRAVPRRIGKNKFEEEEIVVTMPEQIAGNLRNTRAEGSILTAAFKNMQRRNILAPTVDLGLRRRTEVKRFVRNGHKEEPVPLTKEQWKLNMNIKKKK